jgi:hypothetical protein
MVKNTQILVAANTRQSCTTSALNSFVNDRLFRDPGFPIGVSWRILAPAGMSTKRGEAQSGSMFLSPSITWNPSMPGI